MTCPEARQLYAALIAGELGISETALVEAHLNRCASGAYIAEPPVTNGIRTDDGGSPHRAHRQRGGARKRATGTKRARAFASTRLNTEAGRVGCHRVAPEHGATASPTGGTGCAGRAGSPTFDLAYKSLGDGCRRADLDSRSRSGRARH